MVKDLNTVEGMKRAAKDGKMVGRVPFGYVLRDGEIEIISEEADIIQQIYRLYHEERKGFSDISHFLNSQGLFKRGKPWESYSVKRIVENETYYGFAKVKGEKFKGNFPAIITEKYVEKGESLARTNKIGKDKN
jgi:hypothetical protein